MIIIIIFCILSPYTFAADKPWANTSRAQRRTSRTPNQNTPEQLEPTFAAYGTLVDTPRPQHVYRRTSRTPNQNIPEQPEIRYELNPCNLTNIYFIIYFKL